MLKIEYIWRELLYRTIEKNQPDFTITELSKIFNLSTSVVSHALFPLKELGIVSIKKKVSKVIDTERLLFFWATRRNLKKEIIYSTYSRLPILERESSMPGSVIPTAYSAYRFYFQDAPADYENMYFYAKNLDEIKKRFPKLTKKQDNFFILKPDPFFKKYKTIPLAQVFSDLWNLPEWYAKDFQDETLSQIRGRLKS